MLSAVTMLLFPASLVITSFLPVPLPHLAAILNAVLMPVEIAHHFLSCVDLLPAVHHLPLAPAVVYVSVVFTYVIIVLFHVLVIILIKNVLITVPLLIVV